MKPLLVCVCLLVLCACQGSHDFVDANGHGHSFADYQGKWVIINYWATWCGPCKQEIPELNKLAKTHQKQLVLLGVDYDQPQGTRLRKQIREMKIEYTVIAKDPQQRLGYKEPEGLPTTYIFAPGLLLKATLAGPQTEASILAAMGQSKS